jgi:hypothetical protein
MQMRKGVDWLQGVAQTQPLTRDKSKQLHSVRRMSSSVGIQQRLTS